MAKKKPSKKKKAKKAKKTEKSLLAVVRVRGIIGLDAAQKRTFKQLNLGNKNWCVVIENTPSNLGMIRKVKDFLTWGEIFQEMLEKLAKERGEPFKEKTEFDKGKYIQIAGKKYKKYFRLSPPKKGYGRKGIKIGFKRGGALGNRGKEINDLLERMI